MTLVYKILAVTSLAATILSALPCKAQTYDPRTQFSGTTNPNGVWSYGYGSTLGGSMTLFTAVGNNQGCPFWNTGSVLVQPLVGFNPTGSNVTSGDLVLGPNQLDLNPVPSGTSFTTIRFTAPAAGLYNLSGSFYGLDTVLGTTTQGNILMDGASVFSGAVNGFGPGTGPSFNFNETLKLGDYLDFAVTYLGPDDGDTGLALTLTVVPEPSTITLAGIGAAALMIARRRGWLSILKLAR